MTAALQWLAGGIFAGCLLCSCSLRLPVDTKPIAPHTQRHTVEITDPKVEDTVPVWLISNDFHTAMVFPYRWLLDSGFIPPANFPDAQYVTMSWGNTDAYSKQGISSPIGWMRVLFTPTNSVMEMIPINWKITEVIPQQRIWIKQVERHHGLTLAHFLNQCSRNNEDGTPVVVRPSSWGDGVQLEGDHSYFIPRVCNVWSVQAIECLGGKINPWLALTANGLIRQAEQPPNNYQMIWNAGR